MTTPETAVEPLDKEISDNCPCPEGDIFSLPTKAEIVNAFNQIFALPGELFAKLQEIETERRKRIRELEEQLENPDLTLEEREEIQKQIEEEKDYIKNQIKGKLLKEVEEIQETIDDFVESLSDILSPYWDKDGQNRNWQKEARDAFTELLQEFHTYIPTKIAEFISKLVPFNFKINLLGLEIDILKLATNPGYGKELKEQIAGKNFVTQIVSKQKRLAELKKEIKEGDFSEEELAVKQEEIAKLEEEIQDLYDKKSEWVDGFFKLIPEEFRQFDGEFGVLDDEAKAKLTWKYIKTEIKAWIQNAHMKAFNKLIGIFDKIWKLLGLPSLPFSQLTEIMNMDIGALIEAKVKMIKEKWEKSKLGQLQDINQLKREIKEIQEKMDADDISMDEHIALTEELEKKQKELDEARTKFTKELSEFHQSILDSISEIKIFGFDILKIIGGKIESTTESIEEKIAEIAIELEDFKMNWHKKILFGWVKIVKKFFSAIGLGKIFEVLFLTWCDFLKLIGMPTNIGLAGLSIAGIATVVSKKKDDDPRETDTFSINIDGVSYSTESGNDDGVSYADADGDRTEYGVTSGTGSLHAFVDGVEIDEGSLPNQMQISGNTVTFNTAPAIGAGVSIIKI